MVNPSNDREQGQFFCGRLINGELKVKRIPWIDGGASITWSGGGVISVDIPAGPTNVSRRGSSTDYSLNYVRWPSIMQPGRDYLGYIDDPTDGYTFVNMGPVTSVKATEDIVTVTAAGIGYYLHSRLLSMGTLTVGSSALTMNYTTNTLGPYTTYTQLLNAALGRVTTRSGVYPVPIYADTTGYGTPDNIVGGSATYSYSWQDPDYISIMRMLDDLSGIYNDDVRFVGIPRIDGQTASSTIDFDSATNMKWQLAGPATIALAGDVNLNRFGSAAMSIEVSKVADRFGTTFYTSGQGVNPPVTGTDAGTSHSTLENPIWEFWESSIPASVGQTAYRSYATNNRSHTNQIIKMRLPKRGSIRPGWHLLGRNITTIIENAVSHPVLAQFEQVDNAIVQNVDVPAKGDYFTIELE